MRSVRPHQAVDTKSQLTPCIYPLLSPQLSISLTCHQHVLHITCHHPRTLQAEVHRSRNTTNEQDHYQQSARLLLRLLATTHSQHARGPQPLYTTASSLNSSNTQARLQSMPCMQLTANTLHSHYLPPLPNTIVNVSRFHSAGAAVRAGAVQHPTAVARRNRQWHRGCAPLACGPAVTRRAPQA